jgi:hypothetical protein
MASQVVTPSSQVVDIKYILENVPFGCHNQIISLIPVDDRLFCIMAKYNFKYINNKLNNFENSMKTLDILYSCADKLKNIYVLGAYLIYGNGGGSINKDIIKDFTKFPTEKLEYKKKLMIYHINKSKDIIIESIRYYIKLKNSFDIKQKQQFASLISHVFMKLILHE